MQRTKETKRLRAGRSVAEAMLVVAALSAASAQGAEPGWFTFVNNCQVGFTCTGNPPETPRVCWCEMNWNDSAFWQLCSGLSETSCTIQDPPTSIPEHTYERVKIEHSSTDSRCDGGPNNKNLCTTDSDCAGLCVGGSEDGNSCAGLGASRCTKGNGTCPNLKCEPEQYLLINLTNDVGGNPITINTFTINPESAGSLDIRFESFDAAGNTLTTSNVTLDGTNGPVEMSVSDSAEVKTQ